MICSVIINQLQLGVNECGQEGPVTGTPEEKGAKAERSTGLKRAIRFIYLKCLGPENIGSGYL